MKFIFSTVAIFATFLILSSCSIGKKEMSPEDFIKIETEFLSTDMTEKSKAEISKKYGYSVTQFEEYAEKVEKDLELKTKLGEIRLNMQNQSK